MIIIE
jgi:3-methyladenine DNA glycosylase AlkC